MNNQIGSTTTIITAEIITKSVIAHYFSQGLSERKIASLTGVSRHVVRKVVKRLDVDKNELLDHIKKNMANDLMLGAQKFLTVATSPGKLEKASLLQAVTGMGIAIDKARLLQGESTENLSIRANVSKLDDAQAVLEQLLHDRKGGGRGSDPVPSERVYNPPIDTPEQTAEKNLQDNLNNKLNTESNVKNVAIKPSNGVQKK
jgi:hypothetical protein